jgi:hypothetical protein
MDIQTPTEKGLKDCDSNSYAQAKGKISVSDVAAARNTPTENEPDPSEVAIADESVAFLGENPLLDSSLIFASSEGNLGERSSKARLDGNDPEAEGKSSTFVTFEEDIAGKTPSSGEKMESSIAPSPGQTGGTTKQDNHPSQFEGVIPKKGVYVWIDSFGINQVFPINGLSPNDERVELKEIDHYHHIMAPTGGLGEIIHLDKRILENSILKHAFAAHLELQNPYKIPKFEYQAEVLYIAVFSSISLERLGVFKPISKALSGEISLLISHTTVPSTEGYLNKGLERELESSIHAKILAIKKKREVHLVNKFQFLRSWLKYENLTSELKRMVTLQASENEYVRVSELRLWVDRFLWTKTAGFHQGSKWLKFLSPDKVPTVKEILYWILRVESFADAVTSWLEVTEREMSTADKDVNLEGTMPEEPFSLFCAVILIDTVAEKAEKFILCDDIQHCLKRFPKVYIQ